MADEDLDLVIHLGDYIYEYAGNAGRVRRHTGREIESLDDYRNRYALYKSDTALQAAHAACPWIVTWDDHEVDNNYAAWNSEALDPADAFLRRRAAAYQAYYEHMPLRAAAIPSGPDMLLYRQLGFGDLVECFVLDTRQYRTDQPCGDGSAPVCDEVRDPRATLLGGHQARWLVEGLDRSVVRTMERACPAGHDGARRPTTRRRGVLQHGPVGGLPRGTNPLDGFLRQAYAGESGRP